MGPQNKSYAHSKWLLIHVHLRAFIGLAERLDVLRDATLIRVVERGVFFVVECLHLDMHAWPCPSSGGRACGARTACSIRHSAGLAAVVGEMS